MEIVLKSMVFYTSLSMPLPSMTILLIFYQ